MEFKAIRVEPRKDSLTKELIFTFEVSHVQDNEALLDISVEVFSESKIKIGNLRHSISSFQTNLNAEGASRKSANATFQVRMIWELSEAAVQHIENYRTEKKQKTKDVVFKCTLVVKQQVSKISLAHIVEGEYLGKDQHELGTRTHFRLNYKFDRDFYSSKNNLWVLSASGSAHYGSVIASELLAHLDFSIDLMTWVNEFAPYLGIGDLLVIEFPVAKGVKLPKKFGELQKRLVACEKSILESKKHILMAEWKSAIIALRPFYELVKTTKQISVLQDYLIAAGYTKEAVDEMANVLRGFFDFISKFHHALKKNNLDPNPEIVAMPEDAQFIYMNCVGLLNLISTKAKRLGK